MIIFEQKNFKRTLVTSALPYANGSIHIGHLVEYIQTDVFVRFLKLIGEDAIYCCADDTHGTAIEVNAAKQNISPEELIAKYHKEHQEDFNTYSIEFDSYYSTNSDENRSFCDLIFTRLKDKGLIYTKEVENYYDEEAERFLPDRFIKGTCPKCGAEDQYGDVCEKCNTTYKPIDLIDPYSILTKATPIRKTSSHYFFKLSALSEKLENWLFSNKNLQPEIVNYLKNWIKEGLEDWDISRDGPYFGFKIPGEENKYYYVWLDAPIGYISSTENYCKSKNNINNYKVNDYWNSKDSRIVHFIGKDIIYFHLLFWPAMLMEAGFNLPEDIVVHGFLTVNKEKMSKSRGTFLTAKELAEKINPEHLRFYYVANLTSRLQDIDLDFNDLKERVNSELVANIGNFMYRAMSFTNRNYDSELIEAKNDELSIKAKEIFERVKEKYNSYEFREVIKSILELSSLGNKYMQDNAPWKAIKGTDEEKIEAHKVLSVCINLVKDITILLKPILPNITKGIESQLNVKDLSFENFGEPLGNHKINKSEIVFKKIEELKFDVNPFSKLNLKVAKIIDVQDHSEADRLYVLKIDLGTEQRQIVAGIKENYKKEELLNKNIIVVSNLKPAKLKGVESRGMLLAAKKDKDLELINPKNSIPGEQVFIEGITPLNEEITIKDFAKAPMTTKSGKVVFKDQLIKTATEEITVSVEDGADVS